MNNTIVKVRLIIALSLCFGGIAMGFMQELGYGWVIFASIFMACFTLRDCDTD